MAAAAILSKMAAAAIFENRKIAISRPRFERIGSNILPQDLTKLPRNFGALVHSVPVHLAC